MGREIRQLGSLARAWRLAAYQRELGWAAGEGLDRRNGFRGLSDETGPNPAVELLHGALTDRLDATT